MLFTTHTAVRTTLYYALAKGMSVYFSELKISLNPCKGSEPVP